MKISTKTLKTSRYPFAFSSSFHCITIMFITFDNFKTFRHHELILLIFSTTKIAQVKKENLFYYLFKYFYKLRCIEISILFALFHENTMFLTPKTL